MLRIQEPEVKMKRLSLPRLLLCSLGLLLPLFVTACAEPPPSPPEPLPPETWFSLSLGDTPLQVQLAVTPQERSRGLMFREELGDTEGMLFVFSRGERRSFYMRNTSIPLQIGYFRENGELAEIRRLIPHDLTPVPSTRSDIQFALEVNPGWFRENGVRIGDSLPLEKVAEALQQRGFAPSDYGLPNPVAP